MPFRTTTNERSPPTVSEICKKSITTLSYKFFEEFIPSIKTNIKIYAKTRNRGRRIAFSFVAIEVVLSKFSFVTTGGT